MKNTAVLVLSLSLASGTLVAQDATVRSLLSKDLAGIPGKELSMITVEYQPGGSDQAHRHHAQVVSMERSIVMQVKGEAPITLTRAKRSTRRQTTCTSSVERQPNSPAKFLVFFVKDKGAPILVPAKWPAASTEAQAVVASGGNPS